MMGRLVSRRLHWLLFLMARGFLSIVGTDLVLDRLALFLFFLSFNFNCRVFIFCNFFH